MNAIVVYSSKTGFSEKYAKWIAEELSARAIPANEVDIEELHRFDTIIFGGGLYVGGISGLDLIKKNLGRLEGKRIAVFATGASPAREETIIEIRDKNLTKDEQRKVAFFYLRGGFDYDRLNLKDKMLMTLLKKKLQSKKELDEDEKGMLAAYEQSVDFTKKENIKDLIDFAWGKKHP